LTRGRSAGSCSKENISRHLRLHHRRIGFHTPSS
jgi:hypothetical protein